MMIAAELTAKLDPLTVHCGASMVRTLYDELATFYTHVMQPANSVARVAELMRLISLTEVSVDAAHIRCRLIVTAICVCR